jgi:hypothetical protein
MIPYYLCERHYGCEREGNVAVLDVFIHVQACSLDNLQHTEQARLRERWATVNRAEMFVEI